MLKFIYQNIVTYCLSAIAISLNKWGNNILSIITSDMSTLNYCQDLIPQVQRRISVAKCINPRLSGNTEPVGIRVHIHTLK